MIKTINLTGSEVKVTELGGDNTEIINNSSGIIYASNLPNITIGGNEVIAIPAGAIDGLYGTHGTVYLQGTGSVELRGVDHKITESRGQSVVGSVGVVQDYIDSNDSATLKAAKNYTDSITSELAGYIGYTDNDIYGLEADFENSKFTRLAGAVGKKAGADFDSVRAYGGRRRCNLSDSGEVLAYYGDENFKADGTNGQVMVEQPKFYYRVVPLKTEKIDGTDGYHLRKARYYISDTPKAGFKVHPAFVRDGVEVDRIYLSAFEGCIYDTSTGKYLLNDEQVADFNNDKLSSVSGAKPCSGQMQQLTRANARKMAHNRSKGWDITTIQSLSATQMLLIIEYATFDSQNAVGPGGSSNTTSSLNKAETTGATASLGNSSGMIINSDNARSVSYRGEENLWCNIWSYVDGINISNVDGKNTQLYIADNNFVDAYSSSPYKNTSIFACSENGYISSFGYSVDCDWLFIPTEAMGSSAFPVGDYFSKTNNISEWSVFKFGGAWSDKAAGGIFCISFGSLPSTHWNSFGARLQYYPN